jgi:hypothetical protein
MNTTAMPALGTFPELNLITPQRGFFFEKWYFDAQAEDGSFLLTYLAPITVLGVRSAELVLFYAPAGAETMRRNFRIARRELTVADNRLRASFGCGQLEFSQGQAHIEYSSGDTHLRLTYEPLDPFWCPSEGGIVATRGARSLRWVVPIPRAKVTVECTIGTQQRSWHGLGYHDFVQMNMPPWQMPVRELRWGRALGNRSGLVWNDLTCAAPRQTTTRFARALVCGDYRGNPRPTMTTELTSYQVTTWQAHERTRGTYPAAVQIDLATPHGVETCELGSSTLFVGDKILDLHTLRGKMERALYRLIMNDPCEYKLCATARLSWLDEPVLAAHELVLFGKAASRHAAS